MTKKVGSNHKTMKDTKAFAAQRQEEPDNKIRIRVARLMTSTVIRWKRPRKEDACEDSQAAPQDPDEKPAYDSRLIECSRCGNMQGTWWMQLKSAQGYTALHCTMCKKQERSATSRCSCGKIGTNASSTGLIRQQNPLRTEGRGLRIPRLAWR